MAPCDISIKLDKQNHCFDNSAYSISGQIIINAHAKFNFKSIEAKLVGYANSTLRFAIPQPQLTPQFLNNSETRGDDYIERNRGNSPLEPQMFRSERHQLVKEVVQVFPLGDSTPNVDFVMLPGKYEYDFEIPLPQVNYCSKSKDNAFVRTPKHDEYPLPPTVDDINQLANVGYEVTAILNSSKFFSMNAKTSLMVRLVLRRKLPSGEVLNIPVFLEIRSNGFCETVGEMPTFKLFVLSEIQPENYRSMELEDAGCIYLRSIEVLIKKHTKVRAYEATQEEIKEYNICSVEGLSHRLDLSHAHRSNAVEKNDGSSLYELEIPSSIYQNVAIPKSFTPTFEFCNIKRDYEITIKVGLSGTAKAWEPEVFELQRELTLLSGVCDQIDKSEKELLYGATEKSSTSGGAPTSFI
ncbi:unnamed protein product [Wickerhamomyces anomalus]